MSGLLVLLSVALGTPSLADESGGASQSARVLLVSEPPQIDGRLDESFWQRAEPLGALTQVIPVPGASPSQTTDVRVVRTERALYIGVRCYDDQPGGIVAQVMEQGVPLYGDDHIGIALDTFRNERSGFVFYVNPRGARFEELIEYGDTEDDWVTIWQAAGSIDDQGWVAEVEIPFESISFAAGDDVWGMNFLRVIRRTNEELRWADADLNRQFINLSEAGELSGMLGASQGIGLDVIPVLRVSRIDDELRNDHGFDAKPGGEVFYRPVPEATVAVTGNADFGDTEADEFQLNSSRFGLQYPEKRAFFLQDANIFEFGDFGGGYGGGNGTPFFSRRIGLRRVERVNSEGEYETDYQEVPLLLGGKVTGRVGPVNFGVLETWTDSAEGVGQKSLGVERISVNVGKESRVGAIATHGDPQSDRSNALLGFDGIYRTSDFGDGKVFQAGGWYQRSFTEGQSGLQSAWGGGLSYPNDRVNWELNYKELSDDFHPGLGFVNRTGIRRYQGEFRYRIRPDWMRTVDLGLYSQVVTNRENEIKSSYSGVTPIWLTNAIGDELWLGYSFQFEQLDYAWSIPYSGITVPVGRYPSHGGVLRISTSQARPVSFYFEAYGGQELGGRALQLNSGIYYQPSRHLRLSGTYTGWYLALDQGNWKNHVASGRVDVMFTVDLSWNTLIQWRSDTQQIVVNSRLRWIVVPGRELALVVKEELRSASNGIRLERSEAPIVKIRWTFRF